MDECVQPLQGSAWRVQHTPQIINQIINTGLSCFHLSPAQDKLAPLSITEPPEQKQKHDNWLRPMLPPPLPPSLPEKEGDSISCADR